MADGSGWLLQWALILVLTALLLSVAVLAQTAGAFWAAYAAAPREMATLLDTADFSVQENESYDRDVAKVQRLEDKIRLGQLLREIQKSGDDLREELSALLLPAEDVTRGAGGTATTMRTSTRLLWAAKRVPLEDRVRRLDLLRMRFLVVYLGIITSIADKQPPPPPPLPMPLSRDSEKMMAAAFSSAAATTMTATTPGRQPVMRKSLTESMVKRPPVRRLTTQAIGHQEDVGRSGRQGWAGVVEELQLSPRMHQRHASIERSMSMSRAGTP